ncbi:MAG: phosphoribosylformylglycinamidine synthase subunit PurS [Thermodesulfobacteriota bacterium]
MVHRIEVMLKKSLRDAFGEKIRKRINEDIHLPVRSVRTIKVFTIDAEVNSILVEEFAGQLFCDPISQEYSIDRPLAAGFDWLIEVGFRPGVTDNEGKTARESLELAIGRKLNRGEGIYTSTQYALTGDLFLKDAERIATGLLANTLIQSFRIKNRSEWDKTKGMPPLVPRVIADTRPSVEEIDLAVSDERLLAISRERVLALNLAEMKAIRNYITSPQTLAHRRDLGLSEKITDVELECLAQTWSEHCKHKIFTGRIHYTDETGRTATINSLFDTYIKASTQLIREAKGKNDFCLSVFRDNAGVIKFNDEWNLAFKVETHNTPSALDPYGGALTGIVGVNRDPFGTGKGAKLIFNTDVFCFAPPDYDKPLLPRLLHPKRIFEGVREGVEHGGNKSGIPTVNGCIVFDERYLGKPLVFCGTGGIMPATVCGQPSHIKKAEPGDLIVMTGGRIGKDGIHGATFSSEELHAGSPATAVQIGDPITQKKMTDFLLVARDQCLYRSITDNGAGGLSSSVGEMAQDCGGFELQLEKAPLKYAGLNPWEIFLSEAQERMTLAVPPENKDAFLSLAEKMGVEATVLGRFNDSGRFLVTYEGKTVACLDTEFVHNGLPQMEMVAVWTPPRHPEPDIPEVEDLTSTLETMLGRLNICSKEYVVRQYDHEVQGGGVIKPLSGVNGDGPSDAAVIRPVLSSFEGIVVANGICPRYSDIDTYNMMACAVDEAIRNAIASGGDLGHMAGLDNFCWCDPIQSEKTPDGRYKLAQLVRANQALYDYTTAYGVPCISGKDSMKNDYIVENIKISIPPTVLFSVLGKIDDVRRVQTMDAKSPGDLVYVIGLTRPELGGSEYFALHGYIGNNVPRVDAMAAKTSYEKLAGAIREGLVACCHDCSDGGLGIALAETAFAGGLGMKIDLAAVPREDIERDDYLLFSESQSRFVVTVHPDREEAFVAAMQGTILARIGRVTEEPTLICNGLRGDIVVSASITRLKEAWQRPLHW